jgi:hypothetical protein
MISFENKVAWRKMQLDGQFARCPAAVECPGIGYLSCLTLLDRFIEFIIILPL